MTSVLSIPRRYADVIARPACPLGRVVDVETVEPVLRFGFVLAALDEALGLGSPEHRPGFRADNYRDHVPAVRRRGDAVGHAALEPPASAFRIVAEALAAPRAVR